VVRVVPGLDAHRCSSPIREPRHHAIPIAIARYAGTFGPKQHARPGRIPDLVPWNLVDRENGMLQFPRSSLWPAGEWPGNGRTCPETVTNKSTSFSMTSFGLFSSLAGPDPMYLPVPLHEDQGAAAAESAASEPRVWPSLATPRHETPQLTVCRRVLSPTGVRWRPRARRLYG
jgi:hypothetical protein